MKTGLLINRRNGSRSGFDVVRGRRRGGELGEEILSYEVL